MEVAYFIKCEVLPNLSRINLTQSLHVDHMTCFTYTTHQQLSGEPVISIDDDDDDERRVPVQSRLPLTIEIFSAGIYCSCYFIYFTFRAEFLLLPFIHSFIHMNYS
jgi:hypothetical protein